MTQAWTRASGYDHTKEWSSIWDQPLEAEFNHNNCEAHPLDGSGQNQLTVSKQFPDTAQELSKIQDFLQCAVWVWLLYFGDQMHLLARTQPISTKKQTQIWYISMKGTTEVEVSCEAHMCSVMQSNRFSSPWHLAAGLHLYVTKFSHTDINQTKLKGLHRSLRRLQHPPGLCFLWPI